MAVPGRAARWLVAGQVLAKAFDPRDNALNFLRLLLATSVIFGHAAAVGGYPLPRALSFLSGGPAVDGFFAISGFLITRSWGRRPHWGRYLWHRVLRIFPGFWVCLAVTALVIAPLGTLIGKGTLAGYWSAADGPFAYIKNNLLLFNLNNEWGIAGGPTGVPRPSNWNGSLWSLYWEFLCYLGVGTLGVLGFVKKRRWFIFAAFLALWVVNLVRAFAPDLGAQYFDTGRVQSIVRLAFMFLAGSVLYLYAHRIRVNATFGLVGLTLFFAAFYLLPDYRAIGGLGLAYALLLLGSCLPVRIGSRTDLSYGMYVYAFPVQQLLALAGASGIGWFPFALLGTVATIPVAAASWFAIERPALRLKNWTPGVRAIPVDEGEPPAAQGGLAGTLTREQEIGTAAATQDAGAKTAARARLTLLGGAFVIVLFLFYLTLMLRGWLIP